MADFFEISEATFYNWKNDHPEFLEAIKGGKIKADAEVANSLYRRAIGYAYDEVTYEKVGPGADQVEVGEVGMESIKQDLYKKKVVTKEVAPDVAAQNIWLKNRRGKVAQDAQRWADRQELTGPDNTPLAGPTVIITTPTGIDLNLPANTDGEE